MIRAFRNRSCQFSSVFECYRLTLECYSEPENEEPVLVKAYRTAAALKHPPFESGMSHDKYQAMLREYSARRMPGIQKAIVQTRAAYEKWRKEYEPKARQKLKIEGLLLLGCENLCG